MCDPKQLAPLLFMYVTYGTSLWFFPSWFYEWWGRWSRICKQNWSLSACWIKWTELICMNMRIFCMYAYRFNINDVENLCVPVNWQYFVVCFFLLVLWSSEIYHFISRQMNNLAYVYHVLCGGLISAFFMLMTCGNEWQILSIGRYDVLYSVYLYLYWMW